MSLNKNLLFLTLILLIGLLVELYKINDYGVWVDEQGSVLAANGQIPLSIKSSTDLQQFSNKLHIQSKHIQLVKSNIVTNQYLKSQNTFHNVLNATVLYDSGNMIGYNIFLHFWTILFGNSDFAIRLLSLLFGLATIFLTYYISNLFFKNNNAALVIAFLMAVHPLNVHYSIEARSYIIAVFFSLLASYMFFLLLTQNKLKFCFLYAIFTSISLLLHYLTAPIFIAHGFIFLIFARNKNLWYKYISSCFLIFILFATWMYIGGADGLEYMKERNGYIATRAKNFKEGDDTYYIPANLKNIITGWFQVWLPIMGNTLQDFGLRIREIVFFLILPCSLICIVFFKKMKDTFIEKKIILWLLFLPPFILSAFATFSALQSGHCLSFTNRYFIFAVPYIVMLLGNAIYNILYSWKENKILSIVSIAVIIVGIACTIPKYPNLNGAYPKSNNWYASAINIKENNKKDTITVNSFYDAQMISLYLNQKSLIAFKVAKQ